MLSSQLEASRDCSLLCTRNRLFRTRALRRLHRYLAATSEDQTRTCLQILSPAVRVLAKLVSSLYLQSYLPKGPRQGGLGCGCDTVTDHASCHGHQQITLVEQTYGCCRARGSKQQEYKTVPSCCERCPFCARQQLAGASASQVTCCTGLCSY